MEDQKRKIVAVLSDLMFTVKIQDAAKRAGFGLVFVKTQQDALTQAKQNPAAMILDLNHAAAEPLETIHKLKDDPETNKIKLLGYVSHVQSDVIRDAKEKGCDVVVARSAFSQNLLEILKRLAES